jgi:hypothetical protein
MRSVAPFFMMAAASEPEDSTPAVRSGTNTVGKILASSILTKSKASLTGIIELRTDGGPVEFAIDEDAALALCTDLERFLTQ